MMMVVMIVTLTVEMAMKMNTNMTDPMKWTKAGIFKVKKMCQILSVESGTVKEFSAVFLNCKNTAVFMLMMIMMIMSMSSEVALMGKQVLLVASAASMSTRGSR
jgi:hypothetical protein